MPSAKETLKPSSIEELIKIVASEENLVALGGQSIRKAEHYDATVIDMQGFDQILEYQPNEYTITIQSGASLKEVAATLEKEGQYFPFDPPLADEGATIGGMVASGLSGPGSQRFGSLRDFIIGVKLIDGCGRLIQGGGKVVKNAAGFDLPKLMVGSLGSLGVLTEASFKVFPKPETFVTLIFQYERIDQAHAQLLRLNTSKYVLDALDVDDSGGLVIRIGGKPEALDERIQNLNSFLGREAELIRDKEESRYWDRIRDFKTLNSDGFLVKISLSPSKLLDLDGILAPQNAPRHYSYGGSCAWIRWENEIQELDTLLSKQELAGFIIKGETRQPLVGHLPQRAFIQRIKQALDPHSKFPLLT